MDINRSNMDSLFTGFQTALDQGLAMPGLLIGALVMMVSSSTAIEKFPFLVLLSTMREWIGPRQVQNLASQMLAVENKDFEHTIGVKRNDIEDDMMGIYTPLFQQMGVDSNNLWAKLATAALCANAKWLDGSDFFVTTRKFGSQTINNKTTSALSATTYTAARLAMMSYCGHNGDPLGIIPDTLMVGPKLEGMAKKIVENDKIVEEVETGESTYIAPVAAPNQNFGTAKVELNPLLVGTYDDYWFLAQTKGVVKPIIVQKRKVGQLVRWDDDNAECVKIANQNEYGLHNRGAAALTLPPLCYGGIVA